MPTSSVCSVMVCPSERRRSAVPSSAPRVSPESRPRAPTGKSGTSAIRSLPGSACAARSKPRSRAAVRTSSISALSRTERVSAPNTTQWAPSRSCGARGTRSRCGLSPKIPQHAAEIRIDPAPSAPSAAGTMAAATAAADPLLEPPVRRRHLDTDPLRPRRSRRQLSRHHMEPRSAHGHRAARHALDLQRHRRQLHLQRPVPVSLTLPATHHCSPHSRPPAEVGARTRSTPSPRGAVALLPAPRT